MSLNIKAYYNFSENNQEEIRRFSIETLQYDSFIKKLLVVFPKLTENAFNVYWRDSENDMICFSSDEEMKQGLSYIKDDVFKVYISFTAPKQSTPHYGPFHCGARREEQQQSTAEGHPNVMPPFMGGFPFPCGPPSYMHPCREGGKSADPNLHRGVVCDGCEGPVSGIRYKCQECPDFDLCSACKQKGLHPEHTFMEIPWPRHHLRHMMKQFGYGMGGRCGGRRGGHKGCQRKEEEQKVKMDSCEDQNIKSDENLLSIGNQVKAMLYPLGIDVQVEVRPSEAKAPNTAAASASADKITSDSADATMTDVSEQASAKVAAEEMKSDGQACPLAKNSDGEGWMVVGEEAVNSPKEYSLDMRISEAMNKLSSMGFNDEGGWLTALCCAVEGDVSKALDTMHPNHK